jgi:hypothetical protein
MPHPSHFPYFGHSNNTNLVRVPTNCGPPSLFSFLQLPFTSSVFDPSIIKLGHRHKFHCVLLLLLLRSNWVSNGPAALEYSRAQLHSRHLIHTHTWTQSGINEKHKLFGAVPILGHSYRLMNVLYVLFNDAHMLHCKSCCSVLLYFKTSDLAYNLVAYFLNYFIIAIMFILGSFNELGWAHIYVNSERYCSL